MRIATWNVNSVRLRLPLVARLAREFGPDVICLQETKVVDDSFPRKDIESLGYRHIAVRGMKGYNGVAILSRLPLEPMDGKQFCGRDDCRHIAVRIEGIDLHCLYIPAGGDVPDPTENDKFAHKLEFLDELALWSQALRRQGRPVAVVGDFNVAPLETDVWSHRQLLTVVSHTPIEVEKITRAQQEGGWVDAVRHFVPPAEKLYSWWSYRARDWAASDRGRRLDHIWVSPDLAPRLTRAAVIREARGWERPSDHVPVVADLDKSQNDLKIV
ncbi:MAG: exodeoxyribonuclease III [Rhodospirillales bacterium]|nr:MAG: exodeoxyribonuclease III [Rhodospirillales bacterium]